MGLNRIYKVVWNKTKGCYVVVSELAKRVGRNKAKAIVMTTAAMAMAVSPMMADAAPAGNAVGQGHANAVALGPDSNASQDGAVALGKQSKATGTEGAALGKGAKAEGNLSVAVGSMSQATADSTMALGVESKASKNKAVALGRKAEATADNAMALGEAAIANQSRAIAIGKAAISSGQDTIAIGTETNAKGHTSIVIGKNAKTTNDAEGTVVIGRDAFSEGSGKPDRPNTVVGRGAYTAFGENGTYRMNAATALGFQAGSGIRVDSKANNKLVDNNTNADSNENVLVKAGYGLQDIKDAAQKVEMDKTKAFLQAGFAHNGLDKTGDSGKSTDIANGLSFYRKSDINEATAIGAEARAIGDQSIAIGGQVVAGDGVVALGGNDTDQLRGNKYQVVTNDAVNRTNVNTIDDYNLAYTESTRTVAGQYKNLVGRDMPTGYRSTYGQSGSIVIGMETHSTTALGTAIGTNSVVRMGAFGATAIGAGSTVQPNAEAAVAIGMGSVANGAYALAGGTASWAEYGDIALGYQAKASGKDGAIAMGRATNAQGDSSIMIGGANIASAAAQSTSFEKSNNTVTKKTVTEKINGKNVNREYTFAGTTKTNDTVAAAYKELTGRDMETNALNFADNKYKNGHASTSLGVHALSRGDLGTAIGAGSRADSIGSVALGVGARANRQNAVAIGTGSTTDLVGTRQLSVSYDKDGNVVDDNSPNKAYTFNWAGGTNTSEGDVVSFGSSGAERQLKNVAAGRVADDSTDAINGSQLNSVSKKLATGWNIAGDSKTKVAGIGTEDQVNFVNGNGTTVTVTKQEEVKNGTTVTTAKGANVKFDVKAADGSITSDANGISVNTDGDTIGKTTDGKLKANTGTINTGDDGKAAPKTGDGNKLATVDTVVNAVNNAAWKATAGNDGSGTETGKSEEKIKAGDVVTFKAGDNLAIKQAGKNFIYSLKPELTGLTSAGFKNAAGDTTVIDGNGMTITPKDAPAKPVSLTKDGLDNGGKTIKNVTSGLTNYPTGTPKAGLVDLSKPATGTPVPDTTAATVGDLRNMGWVVSSDKTTGELTKAYTDQVKNADEVKFVGEGGVTVSGKTENGVRTITVKAEAQEMPEQPVSYTTADGTKVYPKTVTKPDGTKEVKYYSEPNGKGNEIPKENVIASINGPEGTKAPTTLSNVAGNLDGAKKDTKAPTTEHTPVNSTDAAAPNYVNPNNAATVGDVLNAGWNLQNNGTAKDFVKPYDTVNFVNGANTTAVVTTNEDGTTSNVTYNVTGLPVTYTDAEGNPVAKVGDKYYKVNDQGQPVDANGNPSTKVNDKGQPLDAQGNVIDPVDTTKPLKTALVNPTPEADKTSTTSPTSLNNVKNNIPTVNDTDKKAYDVNGAPIDGKNNTAAPITAKEAADLLNPTKDGQPNPNFVGNNAATVSDVLNAGWNLQNNGEARDFVKPYDTVNFVNGANTTAVVTTSADGTTSNVTYNVTGLPVTYTDAEGNPIAKVGDKYYKVNNQGQPVDADGNPSTKVNDKGQPLDAQGNVIDPVDTTKPLKTALVNPTPAGDKPNTTSPTQLGNVANGANTFEPVDGKKMANDGKWYNAADVLPNGQPKENVQPVAKPDNVGKAGLIDFSKSNPNNAATVGDLQNLGWIVSAEGNSYSDQVRNANEVKFVGKGTATVTGETDANGVRTITVKVDDQVSTNNAVTPVVYTDKEGNTVYPIKDDKGNVTYHTTPDGKGENDKVVPNGDVNTSVNGPKDEKGNARPASLGNVKSNLPTVNDADKKAYDVNGTPIDGKNNTAAPITAADAADLLKPTKDGKPNPNFAGNNAATVSDVLNAGWNLQNNGTAKDFVKPYDTVNFVDGANTTAVVTTNEDGTTSNVTYNVTGLPVTFTDKAGNPVSKIGDKYYPVNEKGQPVTPDGKPAVKTNAEGKPVTEDGTVIEPIDTKANPLQSNLVNPNVANSKEAPNNQTTSPTQLGNVANGANTFAPVDGKKMANDGKWYPADQVEPNGQPKKGAAPVEVPANIGKAGLIDFSNSNPNNAATVGDLQNLGWIVSAEGNKYSDQVRNANEVKFVGEGTASVTGKTDENGVRTITVKVDDQVSTNNAQTPVNYTNKDGKKVYPVKDENGNVTYHTTPDGKGKGDETAPAGDVITSLNGPEGTTTPTTLNNVKNNIPAVNDADKKVTNPDGTEKGTAGDVNNINKAPLTATEAADLLKPTKDGKPNPNFAGNNAATVSDVLNAGWNLQNNGTAKDFVKPFDTVNFVDGANTTAVVTTNTDGTTSNVTYNVTGLPVTFTDKDGKPVSKIGDKYYPVNEKGQPVSEKGNPAVGTNNDGDLVDKDGNVIKPIDTAKDPLKSNMVNPNVANSEAAPNNQTTTPTQLGNVANGAETFKPADDVKLANDGKWYNAADVKPNGAPKTAEENNGKAPAPVANPLSTKNAAGDVLEKGNDGNWYKSSDLEKGEPKPNAKQQSPEPKPKNADKAGLINFENSNPNNAATVGDLQNMGFVVSAKDNGYTEQMRNANKVEFKGDNGVQITGKTLADGTREITVALKEGRVTNDVLITDKDGKEIHGVRGEDGKIYTKDPKTGKATKEEIPVKPSDTVTNDGNAYVTGNSVATAIQKSGWNIGIGSTDKAFSEEAKTYERVNPKDNVKYVNGANTTVSMAVDAAEDKDGATVTTTYVKVDVNRDLHIDRVTTGGPAKDKAGNLLKQVNDEYYPENALVNDGKVYPAGTVMIDGKPYPAGSAKDPKTKTVLKDGKPAPEAQPLTATPKDQLADGKDGAMTVKDAKGNDGVSATAKDGKGTLTLKDGKDASQVDISTAKAPADLENTPKDAVRANDGNWYAPADVTVEVKDGKTVVTPKAGKTPIPNAPTMDRIQYTGTDGKPRNVATMDDGLRFVGDDGETISKPLNSTMEFTGGNREDTGKPVAKAATTTGNIGVFNTDGKLSIQLAKDLDKLNSANFESKTDKAGNPLKVVDGKYYPEKTVVKEGKVYPEGTVIIDNKPYPAGTTKDAAGKVVNNGKPATEATPINPIDSKQVQDGPTSRLTGTGLTFNTPTPKDEKGNPLVLVDGKYYKADNLENGKPKADAKAEPVKPAQSTAFTPDGLVVTPETAKVRDANGNPVLDKDGREVVDPTKVVSFGSPTIAVDPKTGKPMVDPKTGEPVMKSGISAGGQVMANVAPGVLDTDAVNVSQLKGVSNMVMNVNNRVNRLGAQAAAMGALRHLQYDPLEPTTIMAGVGAYKGEAALALGIAHYKNESTLFHAGASIGSRGDELMANAGVSWKFGARADETAVKDTFRQGPISSSYTLQDKVSALEAQNQVQKDEINNLKAQLAEVLQYVKKG